MNHPLSQTDRRWISVVITLVVLALILPPALRTSGYYEIIVRVDSPSLPQGWYWTSPQDSVPVGYPTLICYPPEVVSFAVGRGYFRPDSSRTRSRCSQTLVYLVKPIAATPGDTVTVTRDSTRINSRPWIPAHVHETDSKERPLPNAIGTHVLRKGECWALSLWHPRSYDSRYFGPIQCPDPPRIAVPIWPADAAHVHQMARRIAGNPEVISL